MAAVTSRLTNPRRRKIILVVLAGAAILINIALAATSVSVEQITLFVLVLLTSIALFSGIASFYLTPTHAREWWAAWLQGISTEMIGAVATAILLGLVVGVVQERVAEANLKAQLIRQLRSTDNSLALQAVDELRTQGWLYDNSLQNVSLAKANLQGAFLLGSQLSGAFLTEANLQGADLSEVNLQEANLPGANLGEAVLTKTNLNKAFLVNADLHAATLSYTNLREVQLQSANLQNAILLGVNLQGANLQNADLQGAQFLECRFDTMTVLPDGTNWKLVTDMRRFTDPEDPNFWKLDS